MILPKVEHKKRDIWTSDMIRTALDQCTDGKLYVAMNLAFACSMRMGEIMGLTWSNVHIYTMVSVPCQHHGFFKYRFAVGWYQLTTYWEIFRLFSGRLP